MTAHNLTIAFKLTLIEPDTKFCAIVLADIAGELFELKAELKEKIIRITGYDEETVTASLEVLLMLDIIVPAYKYTEAGEMLYQFRGGGS